MAGDAENIKVFSPLKLSSGLTWNYHEICHSSYNLPSYVYSTVPWQKIVNINININKTEQIHTHSQMFYKLAIWDHIFLIANQHQREKHCWIGRFLTFFSILGSGHFPDKPKIQIFFLFVKPKPALSNEPIEWN